MTPTVPTITLNDDNTIPVLGLGVAGLSEDDTERAVSAALQAGYRLIDTASAYGNEAAVGRAIAASGIPRDELFISTKVATEDQGYNSTKEALAASLERLGLDYVDMYMIHWPAAQLGKYIDTYGAMQKIAQEGPDPLDRRVQLPRGAAGHDLRPDLHQPGGQSNRVAPAAESGRAAGDPRRSRHRHRGLQPAGRRQAAGQPDAGIDRPGARQVPRASRRFGGASSSAMS